MMFLIKEQVQSFLYFFFFLFFLPFPLTYTANRSCKTTPRSPPKCFRMRCSYILSVLALEFFFSFFSLRILNAVARQAAEKCAVFGNEKKKNCEREREREKKEKRKEEVVEERAHVDESSCWYYYLI